MTRFWTYVMGKPPESELGDRGEECPPLDRKRYAQRIDLAGQRYGKLTVLAPAKDIGSMASWRGRCDCGREVVVMTAHLRDLAEMHENNLGGTFALCQAMREAECRRIVFSSFATVYGMDNPVPFKKGMPTLAPAGEPACWRF